METADILIETVPAHNDQDPFAEDGFLSIVEVPIPGTNDTLFHIQATREQLEYRLANDKKFGKAIRKADSRWIKMLDKEGGLDICPLHVFGSFLVDYETKEVIYPDSRKNEIPAVAAESEEVKK